MSHQGDKELGRTNGAIACSTRSATCRKVDPGFFVAGPASNIRLKNGQPFPAEALAIIAAAGPRYAVPGRGTSAQSIPGQE